MTEEILAALEMGGQLTCPEIARALGTRSVAIFNDLQWLVFSRQVKEQCGLYSVREGE